MLKRFFYLFIAFSVIHGSTSSSHAMMNMTGEVWDYDNSTHRAIYSCPRPNDCRTDLLASYGFPVILAFASCCGGLIGSCVWEKCRKYRYKGEDLRLPINLKPPSDTDIKPPLLVLTKGVNSDLVEVVSPQNDEDSESSSSQDSAPQMPSSSSYQREDEDSEDMDEAHQKDD